MATLSTRNKRNLRATAFDAEPIGLDAVPVRLYLHQDAHNDKVVGDLWCKYTPVGVPELDKDYLDRVGRRIGIFRWLPGAECLAHDFTPRWDVDRAGGGTEIIFGDKQMGCGFCIRREREKNQGPETAAAETQAVTAAHVSASLSPSDTDVSAAPSEVAQCPECSWTPRKGKRVSSALAAHRRHKHKAAPALAGTA